MKPSQPQASGQWGDDRLREFDRAGRTVIPRRVRSKFRRWVTRMPEAVLLVLTLTLVVVALFRGRAGRDRFFIP